MCAGPTQSGSVDNSHISTTQSEKTQKSKHKTYGLKIGCINARSLYPKIDEIHQIIHKHEFDILGINETWLDVFISDHELLIDHYDLLRHDRNRQGGGVCLFVRKSLKYSTVQTVKDKLESIWINVAFNNNNVGIGCMYRPPSADQEYYNDMLDQIEQVKATSDDIILMGDLNFNYVLNEHLSSCPVHYIESAYELTQLVDKPTRVTQSSSTLIDLILSSMPQQHECTRVLPVSLSDHYLVYTILRWKSKKPGCHNTIKFRDFKNFESCKFIDDLQQATPITQYTTQESFLHDWEDFKNKFIRISNTHAPMVSRRLKQRCNPWITPDIVKIMYKRDFVKSKLDNLKTAELASEYRKLRNLVTKEIRRAKRSYYDNEFTQALSSPKQTWKLINKVTGSSSKLSPPGDLTAQQFSDYFSRISTETVKHLPQINEPPWKGPTSTLEFKLKKVTQESVLKRLKKLGDKSSTDVLGIDSKLLCIGADVVAPALTSFFNMSIQLQQVPKDWKRARVTPVFKGKGDRLNLKNYRPISVLSHVAKVFEHEIQFQLMAYLVENNYITLDQSAYRPYHSTQTSLVRVIDDWLDVICDDMFVGVCSLDISKCFDTIDHDLLTTKLKYYGIVNNEYLLFKSYLSERSQIVSCNNAVSNISNVPLGVPQGSILGPILFLLYVNDVSQHIHIGQCNIYADDTLIYYASTSVKDVQNVLQCCIDDVSKWYEGNRLVINPSKCTTMLLKGRNQQCDDNSLNVTLNNNVITQTNTTCYLGVTVNECLLWDDHINKLCSQLAFKISKLARIRSFTSVDILRKIYFSCVQPTIDYAINVWGTTTQYNINKVQRLQNFAGRLLSNNFDYVNTRGLDLLRDLNIMNVKQRAMYFDLLLMFKCIHGLAPDYLCNQVVMACEVAEASTRFHDYDNVYTPFPRKELLKTSFMYNSSHLWNSMPNDLKLLTSLPGFKVALRKHVLTCF